MQVTIKNRRQSPGPLGREWTYRSSLFTPVHCLVGIGLLTTSQLRAQSLSTQHNFSGNDGANPQSTLILSGKTLYGTTTSGGTAGLGTVFAVNTDGTGFTNLHSFSGSDGASPQAGLVLSGSVLYGTTSSGGSSSSGTLFAINTNGTGFTNFHNFAGDDGSSPYAALILSGSTLYGTTASGGSSGLGTVFAVDTSGRGFTNIFSFSGNDGASPVARLVLSGSFLYGTTAAGGAGGTVFAVNTNGTSFTNLYNFTGGSDGAGPYGGLTLAADTLYGTTLNGASAGNGTIFALNTDGSGFRTIYGFTRGSDGANSRAELILVGNVLYGTAQVGGDSDLGTVFGAATDGSVLTNLHSFAGSPSEGSSPGAGLVWSDNTLYGTTFSGGSATDGTVFSLPLGSGNSPQLTIFLSGNNVVLTWPASASGFSLQSATNLVPPIAWTTVPTVPVVISGLNTVTNPVVGLAQFFRLGQ